MQTKADFNIFKNFDPNHKLPSLVDSISEAQRRTLSEYTLIVPLKFHLNVVQWFENQLTWNFTVTASNVPSEPQMRLITKISW